MKRYAYIGILMQRYVQRKQQDGGANGARSALGQDKRKDKNNLMLKDGVRETSTSRWNTNLAYVSLYRIDTESAS